MGLFSASLLLCFTFTQTSSCKEAVVINILVFRPNWIVIFSYCVIEFLIEYHALGQTVIRFDAHKHNRCNTHGHTQ